MSSYPQTDPQTDGPGQQVPAVMDAEVAGGRPDSVMGTSEGQSARRREKGHQNESECNVEILDIVTTV